MGDSEGEEIGYHLLVDPDEVPDAARALRLLISSEAHEPDIRSLARAVLDRLEGAPTGEAPLTLALSPPEMKITHTALRLALDDTVRDQAQERAVLRSLLEKLPDEHAIRAIQLD